jgi:hypothetical protein
MLDYICVIIYYGVKRMKHLKKYYKYVLGFLIIILIVSGFLNQAKIKTENFNSNNVYNTIKELSSDKYKGRKQGTKENMEAVKYIEEQFKNIGLSPAGEDSTYLRNYSELTKVYNGVAQLELFNKDGKIIKSYKYGEDFIEQGYGFSTSGDVTSGFNVVEYKDKTSNVEKASKDNTIAIAELKDDKILKEISMELKKSEYEAFIKIVPDNFDLRLETGELGDKMAYSTGYEIPTLIAKESAAKEIISYRSQGAKIHAKTTFSIKLSPVADVLGMIPGKGNDYLLVTAHLDHVGPTSDGTIYPGALDNASGVSAMIEIARAIKSQNVKPLKNIVFIAFNAEEGGLLGSKSYIESPLYPLEKTTVVNLDMIGAKEEVPLTLMYSLLPKDSINPDPASKAKYHLKNMAKRLNIEVNEVNKSTSDHAYFNFSGVSAVTLIDYDMTNIHTPKDNIDNVDVKKIDRAMKLTMNYIALLAYPGTIKGYSVMLSEIFGFIKTVYPILALLVILFVFAYWNMNISNDKYGKERKWPIISSLSMVLILAIVNYFPYFYSYAPVNDQKAIYLLKNVFLNTMKSFMMIPLFVMFLIPGIATIYFVNKWMNSWQYKGNKKSYNIFYYISYILVVASSSIISFMYDKPLYLSFIPDFAREIPGRILLYGILTLIAAIISKLAGKEMGIKTRGYSKLVAFSVVFFLLIANFYIPVASNKYITKIKSGGLSISGYPSGK